MKLSKRILILGIVIELSLMGLGVWLLLQLESGVLRPTTSVAQTTSTVTTVLGTAMGGLGGLLLVLYIVLRRRGS
jgi:hypothetical protein